MFLHQLSAPLQKGMFLELAVLAAMIASNENNGASISKNEKNESVDPLLESMFRNINHDMKSLLRSCQNEAMRHDVSGNELAFCLHDHLSNIMDIDNGDCNYDSALGEYGKKFDFENFPHGDDSGGDVFPSFQLSLAQSIQEVLCEYADKPAAKQDVMRELVENGEDILNISTEKIRIIMIHLPYVEKEILSRAIYWIVEPKLKMGMTLDQKEKKIILFELICILNSAGGLTKEGKELLHEICRALSIDREFIDEFSNVVEQISIAKKTAMDLIYE